MSILGNQLEQWCCDAQSSILLVSPFIKISILEKLLNSIKPVIHIQCVTRWIPEEILSGVSDIEVWKLLQNRPNTSLWLKNNLHAKYYRVDGHCLVGSANLTAKALGYSTSPNLELLIELPANNPILEDFEKTLFVDAIEVDDRLFEQFNFLLAQLKSSQSFISDLESRIIHPIEDDAKFPDRWIPTLRNPEELYLAYTKQWDRLTTVGHQAAKQDLRSFPVPLNLSQSVFNAYIGTLLLQKPIIQKIDNFVKTPQRFGAVKNLLTTFPCSQIENFNAQHTWQTLMRWLIYFLPLRYAVSIPHHSEIFYRINSDTNSLGQTNQ